MLPDLLQEVPNVEHLVYSVGEGLGVAVAAPQQVEAHHIHVEFWDEFYERQGLQLAASVAMEVEESLLGLLILCVEDEAGNIFLVAVNDIQIDPVDTAVAD